MVYACCLFAGVVRAGLAGAVINEILLDLAHKILTSEMPVCDTRHARSLLVAIARQIIALS